jgi:hypothetical protein
MHSEDTSCGAQGSVWRRLCWFVLLWAGGVSGLAAAAWLLKAVMIAAGMR